MISSQGVHDRYGGVVPEIASRHHLELIGDVVDDALARAGTSLPELELVAVTRGPGLVAALLVGVATAKGLAAAHELPLAPVDHLHGHVAAAFLGPTPFEPPFLSLIASGGHTLLARVTDHGPDYEVIGQTLDDAAGEAFDKGARLLGLGYPGGPALERLARDGDPDAFEFPTARRLRRTRLLVRRAEDRAAVPGPRPRRGGGRAPAGRPRGLLSAGDRRVAGDPRRAGAARDRARAAVGRRRRGRQRPGPRAHGVARRRPARPAARAVHRQRRDDRQRRPLRRRAPVPGLPRPRRVRDRRADAGRRDEERRPVRAARAAVCATTLA